MISNEGNPFSRASISTTRASRRPSCSCSRNRSRVWCCWSRAAGRVLVGRDRTRRRQQQVEQPLLGVLRRLAAHLLEPLLAHHVDAELHQVADHRLDVAPDVADLGELRRLDLDERRLREPREPARDLGLADAGRPDHQDVLRRDLLGHLRRAASGAACGCAARSRRRASRWPGRRRTCRARRRSAAASARRSRSAWSRADKWALTALPRRWSRWCRCRCRPRSPSPSRRSRARRDRCSARAPSRPPARTARPIRSRRCRRRAR